MEIEEGEFVRTDKGYIFHNLSSKQISGLKLLSPQYGSILKHSKQLIDLIEEGDIIEVLVNKRTNEIIKYTIDCKGDLYLLREDTIKTILTHEQFEQNCYRLEE